MVSLIWVTTLHGDTAKPTVSSQKRSRSNLLCCLLSVISQRPPRLFLSSSHMGSMPSCSSGSNCQHTSQTTAPKHQNPPLQVRFQHEFNIACKETHLFQLSNDHSNSQRFFKSGLRFAAGILKRWQELNMCPVRIKYIWWASVSQVAFLPFCYIL